MATVISVSSFGNLLLALWFWVQSLLSAANDYHLPLWRKHRRLYLFNAKIGMFLPHSVSYKAARHPPAGVMSIMISTVPSLVFRLRY